jgi:hypothetical protein
MVWLLPGFVVLLRAHSSLPLGRAKYWAAMGLAWCAYLLIIIPTSWYGMSLHDCSGMHAWQTPLCLLMSMKVYGVLLFCSSLALLLTVINSSQLLRGAAGQEAKGHRVPL